MSAITGFWLVICAGIAMYAIVTLPSWLFSSINRGALWRLRDEVFDARRTERVPDNPQLQEFIEQIETLILVTPEVSALQLWWLRRRFGWDGEDKQFFPIKPVGGDATQQRRFLRFQYYLGRIVTRQYMTGSWSGLLFVAPRRLRVLRMTIFPDRRRAQYFIAHAESRFVKPRLSEAPESPDIEIIEREERLVNRVGRMAPHLHRDDGDLVAAGG